MYICLHDTFLVLKIVKNGNCRNWGFIFAWDLGVIFLGIPNLKIFGFWKNNFFKFRFQGFIEKCVGCFLVYLHLRVLLNHAPTSTQLYPPPPCSFQPPPSSLQHPEQYLNQYIATKTLHVIAQFPKFRPKN